MWAIAATLIAAFVTHNPVASAIGFIVFLVLATSENETNNKTSGNNSEPTQEKKDA